MIKTYAMRVFSSLLILAVASTLFSQNPISPMGVYIADPTGRVDKDGRLYVYGSLDKVPTTYCSTDYHVLSSSNLKDWTLYLNRFSSKGENDEVSYSDGPLYAPDMMYRNGTYYLYYDTSDGSEGVATSVSPAGPFRYGTKIEGISGIDPNVFVDDDGQAYYFWGQFSAKGAKMNADMKTLDMGSIKDGILTEQEHGFHEGGFVFKRNGWYYYVYTDVTRRDEACCIGYSMSRHPMGPYEYKGIIIDNTGCDPGNWNNHGSVVKFGNQWYVLYHRSTHNSNTMRKACIEPIHFLNDGTIPEVEMTTQGALNPLSAFDKLDAARACLLHGNVRIEWMEDIHREVLSKCHGGDRVVYKYLNFGNGTKKMTLRVKSESGGHIRAILDHHFHGSFGVVDVPAGQDWTELTCELKESVSGVHALWLCFDGKSEAGNLFQVDWIKFEN